LSALTQNVRLSNSTLYELKENEQFRYYENGLLFTTGPTAVFIVDSVDNGQIYSTVNVGNAVYGPIKESRLNAYSQGLFKFSTDSGNVILDVYANKFLVPEEGYEISAFYSEWYPYSKELVQHKVGSEVSQCIIIYPDGSIYGPYTSIIPISQSAQGGSSRGTFRRFSSSDLRTFWYVNKMADNPELINNALDKKFFFKRQDETVYFFDNGKVHGPFKNYSHNIYKNGRHWLISLFENFGEDRQGYFYTSSSDTIPFGKNRWHFVHSDGSVGYFEFDDTHYYKFDDDTKYPFLGSPKIGYYVNESGQRFGPMYHVTNTIHGNKGQIYFDDKLRLQFYNIKVLSKQNGDTLFVKVDHKKRNQFDLVDGKKVEPWPKGWYSSQQGSLLCTDWNKKDVYVNHIKVMSGENAIAGFIGESEDWFACSSSKKGMKLLVNGEEKLNLSGNFMGTYAIGYDAESFCFNYYLRDGDRITHYVFLNALDSSFSFNEQPVGKKLLSRNGKHLAVSGSYNNLNVIIDGQEYEEGFGLCYHEEEDAFFWVSIEGIKIVLNRYDCGE
jgi:hypothetical protein